MRIALLFWVFLCLGCQPGEVHSNAESGKNRPLLLIPQSPQPTEFQVRLIDVGLIGDPDDPSSVGPDAAGKDCSLGRLSTGEYVLSSVVGGGSVFVYGREGQVTRAIGRRGEGPGEFGSWLRLIVGPADTIYVLDDGQARLSVFTSFGEFVHSFPTPNRVRSFARLNDGRFLFHPTPSGPEANLFHLTSSVGEEQERFGTVARDLADLDGYIVAPAHPDGFWTASIWRYELHRWSAPESLEQTVTREVDWFPPDGRYVDGMPITVPPPPVLKHVWDDGIGRIWVYSLVADETWEPEIPLKPAFEWARRTFDTVIEVIDLDKGRVVATDRYDQMLGMVCGSPLVYAVLEDEDGDTRLQVLEPTLVESAGESQIDEG